jgi:hypothetical protein
MRRIIFFAIVCLAFAVRVDAQMKLVPHTPAIRNDWNMGIVNIPEVGFGVGMSFPDTIAKYNFYSLTNVTGYQFTRNIKAGIGYGLQMHDNKMMFPIFGDVRANFNGQEIVPFLAASGGVEVNPQNFNEDSRIFISGMFGVRFITTPKICTDISMGMYVKGGGVEEKTTFFVIKLGIEIKGKKNDALR